MMWLAGIVSTIKSPVFAEFILSLDHTTFAPHIERLATTTGTLDLLISQLSSRLGTRFIIKGDLPLVWRQVLALCFPSCIDRGAIRFVFGDSVAAPWCGRAG